MEGVVPSCGCFDPRRAGKVIQLLLEELDEFSVPFFF